MDQTTTAPKCKIPTCPLPQLCGGWCSGHYQRWRMGKRGAELEKPIARKLRAGSIMLDHNERELVWWLLYNLKGAPEWPKGLDTPADKQTFLLGVEHLEERLRPPE